MDEYQFQFCVPCLFGVEGLVADELRRMNIREVRAEDGRVLFSGSLADCAAVNLSLRCGERVLMEIGSFPAKSFDALFEGTRALPWENILPRDAAFPVTGYSLDSALFSVPDCQRIIKKAVVERMKARYHQDHFPESGAEYKIRFSLRKDLASLYLDTSGTALHKRGYRPAHTEAALRETLAAAMVKLARYRGKGDFCDPTLWQQARAAAIAAEYSGEYRIFASDIDPRAIQIARDNAVRAGVDHLIEFSVADACHFSRQTERGVIVTNPPYGERLLDRKQAEELYQGFGAAVSGLENWSLYVLSSHTEFERCFGRTADKKRKLYNGMIKCDLFMYFK